MKGIINVLKPPGMTSHDVVSFIRRTLNIKRVGHTGTLDPNAAGVLPICIGKATRVAEYFNDFDKSYRGELTLGYSTDTQDKYGQILEESKSINVSEENIIEAFDKFKGDIKQVPPMYSAIRHNGKRLYELAREGKVIERKERDASIYSLKIIKNFNNKKILFDVDCSKGTYVRTLCNDIGSELGTFGHMSFLIRTRVGNFNIEDAYTLEEIEEFKAKDKIQEIIFSIDAPLYQHDKIKFDKKYLKPLSNGIKLKLDRKKIDYNKENILRVYCEDIFIGTGKITNEDEESYLKMEKVLL